MSHDEYAYDRLKNGVAADLMDKAWELLVELAAEKQAAAIRTAQLERERDALKEEIVPLIIEVNGAKKSLPIWAGLLSKKLERTKAAETRAETALAAQRELAIKEYVDVVTKLYEESATATSHKSNSVSESRRKK
jgi:hypothetical protein